MSRSVASYVVSFPDPLVRGSGNETTSYGQINWGRHIPDVQCPLTIQVIATSACTSYRMPPHVHCFLALPQ